MRALLQWEQSRRCVPVQPEVLSGWRGSPAAGHGQVQYISVNPLLLGLFASSQPQGRAHPPSDTGWVWELLPVMCGVLHRARSSPLHPMDHWK